MIEPDRELREGRAAVEAALLAHPAVRDAAVFPRNGAAREGEDPSGWVAYLVASSGAAAESAPPEAVELWPSHGEYPVYDELLYWAMAKDEERNRRYRAAIGQSVPGKVVVDIGTGGEAVLARLCVEAGARRVWAIEGMEESFEAAQETLELFSLEDRIRLVRGYSSEVELPEPVDVSVSEVIGCIGGSEGAAAILNNARRFLAPGGVVIPHRCRTWFAGARLPERLRTEPAFCELAAHYAEEVFSAVGHRFPLRLCLKGMTRDALLTTTGLFEDLRFDGPIETSYRIEETLEVQSHGRLDGFLLWIDLEPGPGDPVSSLDHDSCWLPVFLPVPADPIAVEPGDRLRVTVESELSDDGLHPDYRLSAAVERPGRESVSFRHHSTHHDPDAEPTAFHRRIFRADGSLATIPEPENALGEPAPEGPAQLPPSDEAVRTHLAARLAPGEQALERSVTIVWVDEIPRTEDGRIDHAALVRT